MKIGIICPSEIALRRFMPALQLIEGLDFAGIGYCNRKERFSDDYDDELVVDKVLREERNKAQVFINQYGGKLYSSYAEIIESDDIDAIYIPLPPALHYKWAKYALEHGKHVLVEKPATTEYKLTKELIDFANERNLAFHENYMFVFHNQLDDIDRIVSSGEVGDVRLYRISFGFPMRGQNDFRYNKSLGGGALIDAGGYTIKYATRLLGESAVIKYAQMNYSDEFEVDLYGSAALVNNDGVTVQISYGMDNNYKCDLEVWGSKGCLTTGRVLTAPVGFIPDAIIRSGNEDRHIKLSDDDAFKKSIEHFINCINNKAYRINNYHLICLQAKLVDEFIGKAKGL